VPPNANLECTHWALTPSLEIALSIRGRERGNGGSSTSHPHPQRVLNLSKKFQLKSMREREERRNLGLACSLLKENIGRAPSSVSLRVGEGKGSARSKITSPASSPMGNNNDVCHNGQQHKH